MLGGRKKNREKKKRKQAGVRLVGTNREIRFGFGALRGLKLRCFSIVEEDCVGCVGWVGYTFSISGN